MRVKVLLFLLFVCGIFHFTFAKKISPEEYISKYKDDAIKEMNRAGVPASITLAQGMLESGNGNSELARKAKNHFGIKCHSSWNGPIYRVDDDKKDECFRKYKTVWQSYRDHSDFLKGGKRYAFLFELKQTDYKGWSRGLKKAGYATNKRYANLLIDIIERHNLNQFVKKKRFRNRDKVQVGEEAGIIEEVNNRSRARLEEEGDDNFEIEVGGNSRRVKKSPNWINYIEVKSGDTYYSLAKTFNIPIKRLYKYNECNSDTLLKIGTLIYLQPKKAKGTQKVYVFKPGDDIYRVSQEFGIKLKHIYKRNKWTPSYKPIAGEKVLLKGRRK